MKSFEELFNNYIDNTSIVESTEEKSILDSILHSGSLISFPLEMKYETNNVSVFEIDVTTNEKFIDVPLRRSDSIDIISDISTSGVKRFRLVMNGIVLSFVPKRLLYCSIPYVEVKLRLYFHNDKIPPIFSVKLTGYLVSDLQIRKKIMSSSFTDDGLIYSDGIILREKTF